jgi:hypothetical protein
VLLLLLLLVLRLGARQGRVGVSFSHPCYLHLLRQQVVFPQRLLYLQRRISCAGGRRERRRKRKRQMRLREESEAETLDVALVPRLMFLFNLMRNFFSESPRLAPCLPSTKHVSKFFCFLIVFFSLSFLEETQAKTYSPIYEKTHTTTTKTQWASSTKSAFSAATSRATGSQHITLGYWRAMRNRTRTGVSRGTSRGPANAVGRPGTTKTTKTTTTMTMMMTYTQPSRTRLR